MNFAHTFCIICIVLLHNLLFSPSFHNIEDISVRLQTEWGSGGGGGGSISFTDVSVGTPKLSRRRDFFPHKK